MEGNQLADLRKEIQWLELELKAFREEQKQFSADADIVFGTEQIRSLVPPIALPSLRNTVSSPSLAGYLLVADGWYLLLSWLLREKPSDVLDIGCGCGKLARLLIHHPHVRKYIGFDNYRPSVDWCRQRLQPLALDRFEFQFLDVRSEAYNPAGTIAGDKLVFPLATGSVDLAIAASLFTHLLEHDACNYLSQSRRVLRTGGALVVSLHTDAKSGERYSGNEIRIDVSLDHFLSLAKAAGFGPGQHLGKLLGQDVLVLRPE